MTLLLYHKIRKKSRLNLGKTKLFLQVFSRFGGNSCHFSDTVGVRSAMLSTLAFPSLRRGKTGKFNSKNGNNSQKLITVGQN